MANSLSFRVCWRCAPVQSHCCIVCTPCCFSTQLAATHPRAIFQWSPVTDLVVSSSTPLLALLLVHATCALTMGLDNSPTHLACLRYFFFGWSLHLACSSAWLIEFSRGCFGVDDAHHASYLMVPIVVMESDLPRLH